MADRAATRSWSRRGSAGFVTLGATALVGLVSAAAMVGSPVARGVVDILDGHAWLSNEANGVVMLANGSSAGIDLRLEIEGTAGDQLEVLRVGEQTILVDRTSGELARIDVANLAVGSLHPTDADPAALDLVVAGDRLVVVDRQQGEVALQDPVTLEILDRVELDGALTRAAVDGSGTVWVVDVDRGDAVPLTVAADALEAGERVDVGAGPGALLTVVGGRPAVLDVARGRLVRVGTEGAEDPVDLPLRPGEAPAVARTVDGDVLPVAVNRAGDVVLVDGDASERVPLGRPGHELGEPVAFDGRVYVPDFTDGTLAVVDPDGAVRDAGIRVGDGGRFAARVESGRLWVDDPQGDTAFVLDRRTTQFRTIDKARTDVPSNVDPPDDLVPPRVVPVPSPSPAPAPDPQPAPAGPAPGPPAPAPTTTTTAAPTTTVPPSPPGAPASVAGTPGDRQAVVSWAPAAPNGAPIAGYTVSWTATGEGEPGEQTVAGDQLQLTVDGLRNGATYVFSVVARNAAGEGPAATSEPVIPDGDVPTAPERVTATADQAGQVNLTWEAADPNGRSPVASYAVTATGDDGSSLVVAPAVTGTSATVGDGLVLGTSYRFTVTATNERGRVSEPSEPSEAAIPHRPAEAPAVTAEAQDGAVALSWTQPELGGGTLVHYVVTPSAGGVPVEVEGTSHTVNGLANGTAYTFTVHAVTEVGGGQVQGAAGQSQPVTPGRAPEVSGLTASADARTVNWSFSFNGHQSGDATCELLANGSVRWEGACTASMSGSFQGEWSTEYNLVARASNGFGDSGEATARVTTGEEPRDPSVQIRKGSDVHISRNNECIDPSCARIHVTLREFPSNANVRVTCYDEGDSFVSDDVRTNADGYATAEPCYFGYPGRQVWVTAGNETSNRITWPRD